MADYCIAYQQIASREGQQTIVGNRFLQLWDRPLSQLRTFFMIYFYFIRGGYGGTMGRGYGLKGFRDFSILFN